MVKKGVLTVTQNMKYYVLLISMFFLFGTVGCGSNKGQSDEVIVSEPYSISLYFEKKHSKDMIKYRIFEANTKMQFDRLANKYKMHYDQENCLYEFDKNVFIKKIKDYNYSHQLFGRHLC